MAVKLPRIPRLHLGGPASWRRVLRGVNSLAAVLSITVLLIVVNAVAALQQARWDLSETKAFTLAPQTVELLQQLDQDVTIYAFIKRDTDTDRSGPPLLEAYRAKTPGSSTGSSIRISIPPRPRSSGSLNMTTSLSRRPPAASPVGRR